eukprot:scaffold14533_cov51-Phaeocystis_antarctica.AAC.3
MPGSLTSICDPGRAYLLLGLLAYYGANATENITLLRTLAFPAEKGRRSVRYLSPQRCCSQERRLQIVLGLTGPLSAVDCSSTL